MFFDKNKYGSWVFNSSRNFKYFDKFIFNSEPIGHLRLEPFPNNFTKFSSKSKSDTLTSHSSETLQAVEYIKSINDKFLSSYSLSDRDVY